MNQNNLNSKNHLNQIYQSYPSRPRQHQKTKERGGSKSMLVVGVMLVAALALMIYILVFVINQDGAQCLSNPLVYGAAKLQEINKDTLQCSCSLLSNLPSPTLYFWHNGSRIEQPEGFRPASQLNPNFSFTVIE